MIFPDFNGFLDAAKDSNIIPVSREIEVDFDTPVSLFAKLGKGDHAFLLESLEGGEKFGRYSFIGLRPFMTFRSKGDTCWIERRGVLETQKGVNPLNELRNLFRALKAKEFPGLRFFGGAVGFLGYDIVKFIEKKIHDKLPDTANFNDIHLMFPEILLVHDNIRQGLRIICNCHVTPDQDLEDLYRQAVRNIDSVARRISKGIDYPGPGVSPPPRVELAPEMERERFKEMVLRAKEYIRAGDVIQVVLSHRFSGKSSLDPFHIYRTLRRINPSPYLFYLVLGDEIMIGSSPEILVRLTGDEIYLRPIAGTRPRGKTEKEDKALEDELLSDPKERAEHLMLVDLGRNDVGRVAVTGSVRVSELLTVERYSHVMHLVSAVVGELAPGKDMFDVLEACFPAGTVSGAPKIRAMEIIEELEATRRGPYAGAVGYFGFSGNMDLAITIRTLCQKGSMLYLQAGAGIVADSDPEREWQETVNKAKALMKAVVKTHDEE